MTTRAKYTLSLKSADRLYPEGLTNARNSKNVYSVKWNDLPPAEKFILQLENFGLDSNPQQTQITATCNTDAVTGQSILNSATGTAYVYVQGFSCNSGWATKNSNSGNGVEQRILLTKLDTSFIGAQPSGNIVNPPKVPCYVIDRPSQNGNLTISIENIDGTLTGVQPAQAPAGVDTFLPAHVVQISLTPMTSKEIAEWDCRA